MYLACGGHRRCCDRRGGWGSLRHREWRGREPEETFASKAQLASALLREWKRSAAEIGAKFHVLLIPHEDFEDYPDHERIVGVVRGAAGEFGIPFLDPPTS